MELAPGGAPALLGEAPRRDAAQRNRAMSARCFADEAPDLGDLVVVLLASTLAGLRDRLNGDGFETAAELVSDLVEIVDEYLTALPV
jgi:hypothetical protein